MIPSVSRKNSIYGQSNRLNIVPACNTCNSKFKSGKTPKELFELLRTNEIYNMWTEDKIEILKNWIEENSF